MGSQQKRNFENEHNLPYLQLSKWLSSWMEGVWWIHMD